MAIDTKRANNSSLGDLINELEKQVRTYQADPLTDRTRTNQTVLLVLAFVLLVLANGYVTLEQTIKIKTELLEFVARDGPALMLMLSALCLFYAVTYAACAYTDWTLTAIDRENAAAVLDYADFLHSGGEKPFSETFTALKMARRRRWKGGLSEEEEEEEAQLEAARRNHEAQQELMASKRRWLRRYLGRARRVVRLRLVLEIGFPLAFSSYALYCAGDVLLQAK